MQRFERQEAHAFLPFVIAPGQVRDWPVADVGPTASTSLVRDGRPQAGANLLL